MNSSRSRSWADIDLVALGENVRRIRGSLPAGVRYISVVKADAYGLGAAHAVPALRAGGADFFAVANVEEASRLREVEPDAPILLLSATVPEEDDLLWELRLIPTLSTPDEVRRHQEVATRRKQPLSVHVKMDTGMGRLGIWHERFGEMEHAMEQAPMLEVTGVYSHFARAADDDAFTQLQRRRFAEAYRRSAFSAHAGLLVHIDNSGGLATFQPGDPWNAVRIGLLQFGVAPTPGRRFAGVEVKPALSWHARLSVVKDLPRGANVSYGRTCTLQRDSRVAIVTAGYADGISRACGNRAFLLVRGRRCRVLGNITMDEISLDVTDVPEAGPGDVATIIGRQGAEEIGIHEFSGWAGTIPWETMCAIGRRVHRVYQ